MKTIDIESKLCRHIVDTQFQDLPREAVEYCKLLIIDSLGVAIPGSRAPGCDAVVSLARQWGGNQGSRLMVHGDYTTPPLAALANSTMMHALDFDDTLDASALHTFVTVLPTALATADSLDHVTGEEFITAITLGVDLICRLSLAISRPLSWIRTATCGCFGAAATAAKLLKLNGEETANALGIALSQTAGNAQGLVEGKLVKRIQPGFAAQAGLTAAFMAARGITGSREFLTGKYGFYALYENNDYNPEAIIKELGSHHPILDLSIKPYPACRMTHSSIDAALELRPHLRDRLNEIESMEVTASAMVAQMVGKPFEPGNNPQVDAQFSIPYTVATALKKGEIFLEDFQREQIFNTEIQSLARRVHVKADPHLPAKDLFNAHLEIILKNGETRGMNITVPLGN
ncbi:MAG: MmgE/PrpD family protein, partial [Desulfobacterales bacterium]|nr:MmgE/PrpD family protein [Desulfobacterales bacterium]